LKVIHALPGRIRLELPTLQGNPGLAAFLEDRLGLTKGIGSVRANPRSGRILIVYAPGRFTDAKIKEILNSALAVVPSARDTPVPDKSDVFELERLPLRRQAFFTAAAGILLLISLRPGPRAKTRAAGPTGLFTLEAVATALTGYPVFRTAFEHLLKKSRLSAELLAGIASLLSLAVQESRLGLLAVWLVYLSTLLRTLAMEGARDRIRELLQGRKPVARVETPQGIVFLPGNWVAPGASVIARKKERLAVDGTVEDGGGLVEQCLIRGDRRPVPVTVGDCVFAGNTVLEGELRVRAGRTGEKTYVSRVLQLLKTAGRSSPGNSRDIRLLNRVSLLALAAAGGVYLVSKDARRAALMLAAGTPGAAGMAAVMPLETAAGRAAGQGILIKSARHLEMMSRADTILFEQKTLLYRLNKHAPEAIEMFRDLKITHLGLLAGESGIFDPAVLTRRRRPAETGPACRPEEKVAAIRRLQKKGRVVAVVGDAADDAAALAAADVGLTLARGSDLDLESADIVLAGSDLRRVPGLIRLARQSTAVAGQNIVFSVGTSLLSLSLGALNLLSPFTLALLQNVGTLGILLNSGRLLLAGAGTVNRRPEKRKA